MGNTILRLDELIDLEDMLMDHIKYSVDSKPGVYGRLKQLIEYNREVRKSYIDRMADIIENSTSKVETYQRMAKLLYEMKDILIGEILNSDPSSIDQKVKRIEQLLQKCSIDYMNNDLIT